MSRHEYSGATRVLSVVASEKNYVVKNLKADAVSVPVGALYDVDIEASEGYKMNYLAMQILIPALTGCTPAPTSGAFTIYVVDSAMIDEYVGGIAVAQCAFAYNGTISFEKNEFSSSQPITISPTSNVILANNMQKLQASKNGFIRLRLYNGTNKPINFSTLPYATIALISEEEPIS